MKDKSIAAILAFFFGGLGIHQFYLGNNGRGVLYLLFFWTFIPFIIGFIDFIILITMSYAHFDLKYNNVVPAYPHTHRPYTNNMADQIERLYNMKMQGIITEDEFQMQKKRILVS